MVSEPLQFERTGERFGIIAGALDRFRERLQTPVDGTSLAVFRIALGVMLAFETIVQDWYLFSKSSEFWFRYPYLEWLPAVPEAYPWIRGVLLFCSLLLVTGIWSRTAALVAAILVGYGFLLVPEQYLNHIYLFWIYLFLAAFVPTNRDFALRLPNGLSPRPGPVRNIHLLLLKLQTDIVLIYAGLVKINPDWLALVPLRTWLLQDRSRLYYGWVLDYDWIIAAANYGVIILHVLGAPLLFFRKTRLPVFILYVIFHVTNAQTFNISIFPWLTIAATTLFFDPDWPRVLLRRVGPPLADLPAMRAKTVWKWAAPFTVFCAAWLTFQTAFPLRHYLYPGKVAWTGEGQRFSWQMMLVAYNSVAFWAIVYLPAKDLIVLVDLKGLIDVPAHNIAIREDLTLQLAHQVAQRFGSPREEVRVHIYNLVAWNYRPPALLTDPTVNLVEKRNSVWAADWLIRHNEGVPARYEDYIRRERVDQLYPSDLVKAAGYPAYTDCREFRPPNQRDPVVMCRKPVQR
jgi:vitamin K-dependent gamma-carboxylase